MGHHVLWVAYRSIALSTKYVFTNSWPEIFFEELGKVCSSQRIIPLGLYPQDLLIAKPKKSHTYWWVHLFPIGGSLYLKVLSKLSFGDQKCRFQKSQFGVFTNPLWQMSSNLPLCRNFPVMDHIALTEQWHDGWCEVISLIFVFLGLNTV